jgi:imidazole glycerol-phosphate synthase subunit HisF
MLRPRIIPVLLIRNGALVKTVRFGKANYIGDPMNAVRIFNDFRADELVLLDIEASRKGVCIDPDFVQQIGEEANMPFSVGGGIRKMADIRKLLSVGAERVILCTAAVERPELIREAADAFGSSTVTVCIDVHKKWLGSQKVYSQAGTRSSPYSPVEFAQLAEKMGAGEVIVQSIDRDGCMEGYDIDLVRSISEAVTIPVVALGGAGSNEDLIRVHKEGLANGLAAGSLFVYNDKNRGVLI